MPRSSTRLILLLAALAVAPAASAQPRPTSGYVVYIPDGASAMALADGRSLSHGTLRGVLLADDPASPLHLMTHDCTGTDVLGPDGLPVRGEGVCTSVDASGDLYHITYLNTPEQRAWRYTGGTGKFAGIEGSGTTEIAAVGPDGRVTIRFEGTMQMR